VTFWILQILNGVSFGMLLFVLAAGLTLIFGLMDIINLAHGSLFMVAAYFGVFFGSYTGNFFLAVLGGGICAAIIGITMHSLFLCHYAKKVLSQVLLTLGFLFIIADLTLWVWGGKPLSVTKPSLFAGTIQMGQISYPCYRLFMVIVGVLIGVFIWWFQERTKYGAIVRAGVDDKEMTEAIGINVPLVMTLVFGLGALLAGIAGVMGGAFIGVYPGVDLEVLLLGIAVVIIGGLGSLRGALVGAIIVGLIDSFGKSLFPEFSLFLLFGVLAVVLSFRPRGLFGRR
jgi:branched-chain amino acid transport system permease protein